MRALSESAGIRLLARLRETFRREIGERYERRALPCLTCKSQGACCTDRHFVNVEISRLEAAAIQRSISLLPAKLRQKIYFRASREMELSLRRQTGFYSCPLYEAGVGCTIHNTAKPLPCIFHACYENREDMPPLRLLYEAEAQVARLNQRVYMRPTIYKPIYLALSGRFEPTAENSGRDEQNKED